MGKNSKNGGKMVASIIGAVAGFYWGKAIFGVAKWGGALMGSSLFSSIWSAHHMANGSAGSASIMRFDREQEDMSLGGVVPIVYGERMISGNQTYHETDADANNLHKHVVLCEGGIEGLVAVTANDYNIPTGKLDGNTVFTIQNLKYKDAYVETKNKTLTLHANGRDKKIELKDNNDYSNGDESYFAWQLEVGSLVAYVNKLGDGWEAFPTATTSRSAGDIVVGKCTYAGRQRFRKDGGDSGFSSIFERDGYTCISIPGTREHHTHWHHMHKRNEWDIQADKYKVERGYCYKTPVSAIASNCVGVTDMKFHDSEAPENYEKVGGYPNMAWMDLKFTVSDNLNGNPTVQALIKGRKVLDTRTGITAYSTNPAMCLRDLLLNKTYGGGYWISEDDLDEDSFKQAADWCDKEVSWKMTDGTIVTGKRYELNIVLDSQKSLWDWTQDILATFCGYLVLSKNKLHLRIEKPVSISYKFDESKISELSISQISLDDCPNQYRVKFVDPLNNWKTATVIVDDYSDQRERGKVIVKDIELEGVTSQSQALRLARYYRDYNKVCTLSVEFKTGYHAAHLEPGDVISLSYKIVMHDALFRITEIQETENGEYTIKARQYNDTIYNDELGATMTAYNYSTVKPKLGVPYAPKEATAKILNDFADYSKEITTVNVLVSWVEGQKTNGIYYSVYRRIKGADGKFGDWEILADVDDTSYIAKVAQDSTIQFGVVAKNGGGVDSAMVCTEELSVHVEDVPPATPVIDVLVESPTVILSWSKNTEADFAKYVVEVNGETYTTKRHSLTVIGTNGRNTVTVTAYDNGGNKSSATKTWDMTTKPADISYVSVTRRFLNYYLLWAASTGATYYEITGDSTQTVFSPEATIPVPKDVSSSTVYIRACNGTEKSAAYRVDLEGRMAGSFDIDKTQELMSVDLFDGIEPQNGAEMVVEDGVKTIIKKAESED